MKRILLWVLCLCLLLSGCQTAKEPTASEQWLESANLDVLETSEELYEKALDENVLTIYTVSSRLMDVAESFQEQYPGLQVEVIYTRAEELVGEITEAAASGESKCDLVFCTNGDGSLTENLIPAGLVYKYLPQDMQDKMRSGGNDAYLSVLLEVPLLCYSSEFYDAPPIENWWELTEPEWKGKFYITNPMRSMISYTLFSTMLQREDLMEQAYLERYGTAFVPENGEGVSKAFLRRLVQNDLVIVNDSDDVADAIAKPGNPSDAVGILNASKLRLCESGYSLMVSYETQPFAGVINPANIMMVGGAKNINAAKLFIRWILGEADGTGKGYQPFLQQGAWPSRNDVESPSKPLDSFEVLYTDETYASEHRDEFVAFWETLLQ